MAAHTDKPLNGKIALITGGSRGLGRSMAEHVADRGAGVIITYRSDAAAAEAVVASIRGRGGAAVALPLDATDLGSFGAFAEAVHGQLDTTFSRSTFDFLVNNGGFGHHAPLLETTPEAFDALMGVHVRGPLFLIQALAPLLEDGGRLVNISTGLTRIVLPGYGAYAAMKAALETMSVYLAAELGGRRIRVNTLAPGAIATDFSGGVVRDNADVNAMIASATALGRVGLPDDIGGALSTLLAPESGWINAQRIEASGGQAISA